MNTKESYTDKIHLKAILLIVFGITSNFCTWLSYYFSHNLIGYFILNFMAAMISLFALFIVIKGIIQVFKAHKEPYRFRKIFSIFIIVGYLFLLGYGIYQISEGNLAKQKMTLDVDF